MLLRVAARRAAASSAPLRRARLLTSFPQPDVVSRTVLEIGEQHAGSAQASLVELDVKSKVRAARAAPVRDKDGAAGVLFSQPLTPRAACAGPHGVRGALRHAHAPHRSEQD